MYNIEIGNWYTWRPTDSQLSEKYPCKAVRVLSQLGPDLVDSEVGPMFEVQICEGNTFHAFLDELS